MSYLIGAKGAAAPWSAVLSGRNLWKVRKICSNFDAIDRR